VEKGIRAMKKRHRGFRLFLSILKENLFDNEFFDGFKNALYTIKDFSKFMFFLFIVANIGFVIIVAYNFMANLSLLESIFNELVWGGVCLGIIEAYFYRRRRVGRKQLRRL
jgi:hypothetical protein